MKNKNRQFMSHNMIGYDIYDRFTVEHFPLCQKDDFDDHFFLGGDLSNI
jgi:hypothetical protein